jgi:hypothetical protein
MSQVLTPLYSLFIHNGSLKATVHFPVQWRFICRRSQEK